MSATAIMPMQAADSNVRSPFLTVEQVREHLAKPVNERPLLIDARGGRQYREGHLPQAINVPARELNPVEDGVRRLAAVDDVRGLLGPPGERGLVIYGGRGGADAALLWWTLRSVGYRDVALLDGGIEGWLAAGGHLSAGGETPERAEEPGVARQLEQGSESLRRTAERAGPRDEPVSVDELLRRLDDETLAIVDTRDPEEYSGELKAAERAGHIPGAVLIPWTAALDDQLRLRSTSELRELLAPVLAKPEAIFYCQSGVRAAHTLAVLEMLGHPRPRLYLGSWGEWGNRQDTPIEVGAAA